MPNTAQILICTVSVSVYVSQRTLTIAWQICPR